MAKGLWKVLKIVPKGYLEGAQVQLEANQGLVETIKQWKLKRNAGKAFNVDFGLQDLKFSCKSSMISNPRFELAKNRRPCFPCTGVPKVVEGFMENECYPRSNREVVVSITCTPIFIQLDCWKPLCTPFQISFLNYSLDSEVSWDNEMDRWSEEFIRWFHTVVPSPSGRRGGGQRAIGEFPSLCV